MIFISDKKRGKRLLFQNKGDIIYMCRYRHNDFRMESRISFITEIAAWSSISKMTLVALKSPLFEQS